MTIAPELADRIEAVAREPSLLVCCDYDGTLSPIVEDPAAAAPLPGAIEAVDRLASLPGTLVALLSGRAVAELARLSGADATVTLVGSHGAEFSSGFGDALDAEARTRLSRLEAALEEIAGPHEGVLLERKPISVAVHVRRASRPDAETVIRSVQNGPGCWRGVYTTMGKEVIELSVLRVDKGVAIRRLREESGAARVVFIGDDVTDERGFASLDPKDLGIKVGPGETTAQFRVDAPFDVVQVLDVLADRRDAPSPDAPSQ